MLYLVQKRVYSVMEQSYPIVPKHAEPINTWLGIKNKICGPVEVQMLLYRKGVVV